MPIASEAVSQTSVQCTLYRLERRCMELVLGPCAIILADAVLVLIVVVNEMKKPSLEGGVFKRLMMSAMN